MDTKDTIASITSIVTAMSVVAGVIFGIHEFALKDRDRDHARFDLTVKLVQDLTTGEANTSRSKLEAMRDEAYSIPTNDTERDQKAGQAIGIRFESETRGLAIAYARLQACVDSGLCMKEFAKSMCPDAQSDILKIEELEGRYGNKTIHAHRFYGLRKLAGADCGR